MNVYILTVNHRKEGIYSYVYSTQKGAIKAMKEKILEFDQGYESEIPDNFDQIKDRFDTEDYIIWIEKDKVRD